MLSSMVSRVKKLFGSREEMKLLLGKMAILARAFVSPTAFSKPADRTEWLRRVRANFAHFRNIYGVIFVAVAIYTGKRSRSNQPHCNRSPLAAAHDSGSAPSCQSSRRLCCSSASSSCSARGSTASC